MTSAGLLLHGPATRADSVLSSSTGSPTEGSRCFKIARETGLPVLGG